MVGNTHRDMQTKAREVRRTSRLLLCALLSAVLSPAAAFTQRADLEVRFDPPAGTFVGSQTVSLSSPPDTDIHYTLDGSLPTAAAPIYREPLTLETSTRLRAVAIMRGMRNAGPVPRGPVATEIYFRVDRNTQSFTSHLPIILIHTFESGWLNPGADDHVSAALQVLEPTAGTTRIVGRSVVDARIGIHVRGESSRGFPKKQYAVELRADDGDGDSGQRMLGMPSHADWVLSDPVVYDRALIRNALAYALSNRIGRYAPRTRFAEVFMVNDNGDVRPENFLGFFTLIEKIDRDADRVNVARLPASATSGPAVSGGFIVSIDKGPADFFAGGRRLQFVYPNASDMVLPERRPQLDFIQRYIDDFALSVSAPDFKHPATGQHYSEFIDVDAWIDHHIINVLAKNVDGLRYSTFLHKDREGKLVAGPVWDFDRSFGTLYDQRAAAPEEWSSSWRSAADYFTEGWWRYLFRDPAFTARYRARFAALLNDQFSADNLDRIVDGLAADAGPAAARNFQRWVTSPPLENSHAAEIALLKDFLRRRVTWLKTRLETDF